MVGGVTSFLKSAGKSLLGPAGMLIGKEEKTKTEKKSDTPAATNPAGTQEPEKPLTTDSGKFYAGMSLDEAKKKKLDKSIFTRDFSDIDKDKDGYLSDVEILQERKLEADRLNRVSFAAIGTGSTVTCIPGGQAVGVTLAIGGLIIGNEADKINTQSAEYAKYHNINMKF